MSNAGKIREVSSGRLMCEGVKHSRSTPVHPERAMEGEIVHFFYLIKILLLTKVIKSLLLQVIETECSIAIESAVICFSLLHH